MEVKSMSIDDIKPYENNPRDNDDAVDSVANSIKEFGWQQPIVVDKDNVIIVGHTRYKAAKKLGMDKVPVVVASKLTPEQVKAYRLADNKVGELADWDFEKLNTELDGIEDIDMSEFGFEDFGEPELPDEFFEDTGSDMEPDEPDEPDEPELDWGGANTAPITSDDQSFLDDKFEEFRQQEGTKSFLQFLLSE